MRAARRRLVLACTAALPGVAATVTGRDALAFRLEPAVAEIEAAYAEGQGCRRPALHDELRAEIDRALEGAPLPQGLDELLDRYARCPFCGCPVAAGAVDHGEGGSTPSEG